MTTRHAHRRIIVELCLCWRVFVQVWGVRACVATLVFATRLCGCILFAVTQIIYSHNNGERNHCGGHHQQQHQHQLEHDDGHHRRYSRHHHRRQHHNSAHRLEGKFTPTVSTSAHEINILVHTTQAHIYSNDNNIKRPLMMLRVAGSRTINHTHTHTRDNICKYVC